MKKPLLVILLLALVGPVYAQTLREKIGQMIMVGFNGTTTLDDSLRGDLSERNLGGVVLMGRNCKSPLQLQGLTATIKAAARTAPFIAIDQEGGLVARLNSTNGYATTYTAFALGTSMPMDSTVAQAARMASWLQQAGITTNFAPVADVNVNPSSPAIGAYDRSFSADPVAVASHVRLFIDAFHNAGVMTCLKHFPGHGSAGTDSHLTLPDITNSWADSELVPYRQMIPENRVDMVMVGHLYNAKLDSVWPSSLSHNVMAGLLRDSLNYSGVIISDDLYNMKAITDNYGFGETVEQAVNGGMDVLLYVYNLLNGSSLCRQIVDTIAVRVADGRIPAARIDDAYNRIMALKLRYQMIAQAGVAAGSNEGGAPRDYGLMQNYPNPFNPSTTINYTVGGIGDQGPGIRNVKLSIYNLLGQEVAVLVNEQQAPGRHAVRFDAGRLASGVYLYRLQAGSFVETKRMVLLR